MPRPVSVAITGTSSGFKAATGQASVSARQMATDVTAATARMDTSMSKAAAAAKRLAGAERDVANAAGSVRLAESQLAAVRARGNATTAQQIRAEESLYRANRRLAASQAEVKVASESMVKTSFLGSVEEQSASIDRVGTSLLKLVAVGAVGLAATGKAAMDWQSDWAGVSKTVDGTVPQMAELEGQLRGLAKTLPASHHEIAAVAEAAGQLGIQREAVAGFTKVMIDLGNTTNLSADEAATSLAQFSNIMGTSSGNVDRLGATIVDLGNKGASTERDIVSMGLRIAGAGKTIGLSETDVLAFASSLSSVGIDAEAGGTAISQSFLKIDQAVRTGGAGLDTLAQVSGRTTAQFANDFRTKPAQAVNEFVTGLGRIQAEGGDTTATLKSLGMTGIRETDALRRLAASGNLLSDSLSTSNAAWKSNSALVDEAAKRYATAESQAKIAWNQIKDSAITAGTAMLPVLAQVATAVGHLAEFFGNLPAPVRMVGVSLAVVVTSMALLGGGALKAVTGLVGLRTALQGAGVAATTMGRAMKVAQISIPVVGLALFAVTTAMQAWAGRSTDAAAGANSFAEAMQTVEGSVTRATAAMNENVRLAAFQQLQQNGAVDQAKQLGLSLSTVTDAALGNKDAMAEVNRSLSQNLALNPQASQANANAYNSAVGLSKALKLTATQSIAGVQAERDRRAAMEGGAGATKAAGAAAKQHADDLQKESDALQETVTQAQAAANALLALSGSQIGVEAAIDAASKAAKDNGKNLDINTGKGRANQQALNSLAAATLSYTAGLIKSGAAAEDVVSANERGRKAWVDNKVAMGGNRTEAEALSRTLFALPAEVASQVVVKGGKVSAADAKALNKELRDIPAEKRAEIVTIAQTKGAKAARQAMAEIKDKEVIARSKGDLKGAKQVDAAMKALHDRLVEAKARGDKKGADNVRDAMQALRSRTVTAGTKADTSGAKKTQSAVNSVKGKTVTVGTRADTSGVSIVKSALGGVQSKTVTITVKGRTVGHIPNDAATGGLITPAGTMLRAPLHRSNGGPVWGAGTATSDSIDAKLSHGEFVENASATNYYGAGFMAALNRKQVPREDVRALGFAAGGSVSTPVGLATGGLPGVDMALIMRLIVALNQPLKDISDAAAAVKREQAKIAKPTAAKVKAEKAYESARDRQETLKDRVARLAKEAAATKGVTKADRDLKKARLDLAVANNQVTKTSRDKTAATKAYNDVAGPLKEATDKLTEAQKALADSARSASDSFREAYTSKSTDVGDWLALMKDGTKDLTTFAAQVAALRSAGLSETLVQQVIGLGAVAGGDVASQIVAGGKGLVTSLNGASAGLQKAADNLGLSAASPPQRKAFGGPVVGPGTGTSDSVNIRASAGEWVVPERAASVPANRAVLEQMTYGRRVVEHNYAQPSGYRYGGPVTVSSAGDDYSTHVTVPGGYSGDPDVLAARILTRRRDALARRGLTGRKL